MRQWQILLPYLWRGSLAVAVIFTLGMATLSNAPIPGAPSDLFLHFAAFCVLGALARFAFPQARALSIFLCLSAFGAGIEALQFIPELRRSPSFDDWLADIGGLFFALTFFAWLKALRNQATDPEAA